MILGRKLRNLRLIPSEDLFLYFYFLVFILESQTIFCPIRKVLENYDSGICHKFWAKLHRPRNFFGWYAYGCQGFRLFRYGNPILVVRQITNYTFSAPKVLKVGDH